MVSEAIAGLSIFKTLLDMAKGLKDINDATIRNAAVIELQEKILAAQAQQSTLVDRISELEKEVARFETWEAEKKRYKLYDFGSGTFAYVLKEGMEDGEPPHRACANCFKKEQISILQFRHQTATGQGKYACSTCKTDFLLGEYSDPPVIQTRGPGRSWTDR